MSWDGDFSRSLSVWWQDLTSVENCRLEGGDFSDVLLQGGEWMMCVDLFEQKNFGCPLQTDFTIKVKFCICHMISLRWPWALDRMLKVQELGFVFFFLAWLSNTASMQKLMELLEVEWLFSTFISRSDCSLCMYYWSIVSEWVINWMNPSVVCSLIQSQLIGSFIYFCICWLCSAVARLMCCVSTGPQMVTTLCLPMPWITLDLQHKLWSAMAGALVLTLSDIGKPSLLL